MVSAASISSSSALFHQLARLSLAYDLFLSMIHRISPSLEDDE
jgi:hypothetical protein